MLPHLGHEFVDCMRQHLDCEEESQFEKPLWLRCCQTLYVVTVCAIAISIFVFLLF